MDSTGKAKPSGQTPSTGEAQPSGQVVNRNSYRSCGLPHVQMVGLPLCYPWTKNLKIDKIEVTTALCPTGDVLCCVELKQKEVSF